MITKPGHGLVILRKVDPSTQASIALNQERFGIFMADRFGFHPPANCPDRRYWLTEALCAHLEIHSLVTLRRDSRAQRYWASIHSQFRIWCLEEQPSDQRNTACNIDENGEFIPLWKRDATYASSHEATESGKRRVKNRRTIAQLVASRMGA